MPKPDRTSVDLTLDALLHRQAEERGDAPFLLQPDGTPFASFRATQARTLGLAKSFAAQAIGRGSRVLVSLPNGPETALALLALMRSGAVAVPLNPRLTPSEVARIQALAGAQHLLTRADQEARLPLAGWTLSEGAGSLRIWQAAQADPAQAGALDPDDPAQAESLAPDDPAQAGALDPDDPALILFTSGTTGQAKGVPLSHQNLLANASFVAQAHDLRPEDRALCILALFHINGLVVTLLAPLLAGHAVALPERFEADLFWDWVQKVKATWFSGVPTILSLLLSRPGPDLAVLQSLRFARCASAPLPVALLEAFEARFAIPVIETYGISEAACQVTANPLPPGLRKAGSAGKPVGNALRILDPRGRERPAGAVGEVALQGPNLFAGYLDNPAADAQALRSGWFHTGDLGHLDADGYLFLTGRITEVINRAGEKIAPREVEEVLHQLAAVEAAAVVGVPDPLFGQQVAAFLTLRPGTRLDAESVRAHCKTRLAPFKVPREVFFIDDFPKGPSGKIQRRRLVEHYLEKRTPA